MLNFIHSHTPKQDIFFKPFTQRFHIYYDHKTDKNNYYITPDFGQYTRIVGQDTILEGFQILNTSFDNTSASIEISKGRLIINDTYIEIYNHDSITYDQLNKFDDSGFIVLSASFINEHHLRRNQLRYHLTYFDRNHDSYREFNLDKDKIVFGVFDFEKDEYNNIIDFTQRDIDYITLDGKEFKVRKKEKTTTGLSIDGGTLNICENEDIIHAKFNN